MKKFLSVLLALAVAFTFTFGSTMSAFAVSAGYTVDEAKTLVTSLGATAEEDVIVDYDNSVGSYLDINGKDVTVYSIPAATVQKGIDEEYSKLYEAITADDLETVDGYITVSGGKITHIFGFEMKNSAADAASIKEYLVKHPDVATYEKAGWEAYKTFLAEKVVGAVDTSVYTSTEGTFTSVDGDTYKTSAEAADADIKAALKTITDAKYVDTTSYKGLYTAITKYVKPVAETAKNPATNDTYTTKVGYELFKTYSTFESEKNESDKHASAQARAKADLSDSIIAYRTASPSLGYNKNQEAALQAYVDVMTYLIDNSTTVPEIKAIKEASETEVKVEGSTLINYSTRIELAAEAAKTLEATKKEKVANGFLWDDTAAAKALKLYTVDVYEDGVAAKDIAHQITDNKVVDSNLTAGEKAANKLDYSEVEAKANASVVGKVYALADVIEDADETKIYYEAEWTKVKAAIDTYNAAVDAAKVEKDIDTAQKALNDAIKVITVAKTISDAVKDTTSYDLSGAVKTYFGMVETAYNTNAGTSGAKIYITWDGEKYVNSVDAKDANVYAWAIAKGATDAKTAYALLNEAKAVVDAYKTLDTIKDEAAAVVKAIDALPKKAADVTLADKDAIVAAYEAFAALPADGQKYVTNTGILNADIAALEKAEATDIAGQVAKLPAKPTVADKEAITAYKEAYEAYTKAFTAGNIYYGLTKSYTANPYDYETALRTIKTAEAKAVNDAIYDLYLKYRNNTLTAADADAVKAAQAALDAYIAEYGESPSVYEAYLAKIAAIVGAEEAWTTTDVKASLFDSSRKLTIWRTSKTSIRVTSVGSVADIKDHGYTVEYKFYKKAPGATSYKLVKTTSSNKYTYTNLKKGANKFQVKVVVKDADGKVVASKWTYYRAAKIK